MTLRDGLREVVEVSCVSLGVGSVSLGVSKR